MSRIGRHLYLRVTVMARKVRKVLTETERQELNQIRKFLVKSGHPAAVVRRKLLYFQKFITDGRKSPSITKQ
jgi:hypothetical protein